MPDQVAVLVAGAGPCAIAVLARLVRDCREMGDPAETLLSSTRCVDPSGEFMASWHRALHVQGVSHLRSPTFVHPHPSRVVDDELLAFARRHRRQAELRKVYESDELGAWFAPSARLFADFCEQIVTDFDLRRTLVRGAIVGVRKLDDGRLCATLEDGRVMHARCLVLALGSAGAPNIPDWARPHMASGDVVHVSSMQPDQARGPSQEFPREGSKGATQPVHAILPWRAIRRHLVERWLPPGAWGALGGGRSAPPRRRLLIVGGGLSAAQLAMKASTSRCWEQVILCARRRLRVRPFDISTDWMRRHWSRDFVACELEFFRANLDERLDLLRRARDGGSVPPSTRAQLASLAEHQHGRDRRAALRILEDMSILTVERSEEGQGGKLRVHLLGERDVHSQELVDAVWLATGTRVGAHAASDGSAPPSAHGRLLRSVLPLATHVVGPFPALDPALRWAPDLPVYACGSLSALQIGPDAFNLAGAMLGAARISSEVLRQVKLAGH